MTGSIQVWQPRSEVFQTGAFVVSNPSGQETMTRSQFQRRLEARLEEMVSENPQLATQLLTDSPEHNPDLYGIGMRSQPREYPSLILQSDQMQMLLNKIDWQSPGLNLTLDKSDLPSLREIVERSPRSSRRLVPDEYTPAFSKKNCGLKPQWRRDRRIRRGAFGHCTVDSTLRTSIRIAD